MSTVFHNMQMARPLRGFFLSSPLRSSEDAVRLYAWFRPTTCTQRGSHANLWYRSLSTTSYAHGDNETETLTQESLSRETFRGRGRRHERKISTLSPTRLTPADHIDISNAASPVCSLASSTGLHMDSFFRIECPSTFKNGVFPPNTRGFLYYHRDPTAPPMAGELRFRVTSGADPSLFASGHDLLCDNGLPYHISLVSIASSGHMYENAKKSLVQEGLVSEEVMQKAAAQCLPRTSRILHSFGQPFLLCFGTYGQIFHVVGWDAIHRGLLRGITCIQKLVPRRPSNSTTNGPISPKSGYVLVTGSAICRFEKSTLPQHEGRRVVVCRVLRIVDPIKCSSVLRVPERLIPREGELMRTSIREVRGPCWYIDVDTGMTSKKLRSVELAKALAVLYDNEARARELAAR